MVSSDITIVGCDERSRLWKLRRNIHFAAAAAVAAAPACRHAARRPAKGEESTHGASEEAGAASGMNLNGMGRPRLLRTIHLLRDSLRDLQYMAFHKIIKAIVC